jgi:hypothetical protein
METTDKEVEEVMVPILLAVVGSKGYAWATAVLPEYAGFLQGLQQFEGEGYRELRHNLEKMRAAGCQGVTWYG